MIRHASLFSGIGGADLAAYQVGWTNMFTCEIDDFCNKVLDYWFPNTERYHDIKGTDFSKWRGKIDVLSGGPPCQAVSVAGKRKGDKDDRFLWDEFIRAVREIQPAWIVAENVYGILSMVESSETPHVEREDSLFGEIDEESGWVSQRYVLYKIISEIENEGYEALPVVIPACAVGAPHERKRVWIICHRIDADTEGEPRSEHNRETGDGKPRGLGGVHSEEYVTDSGSVGREPGGDNIGQGQLRDSSRRNDKENKWDGRVDKTWQAGKITADTDGELVERRDGETHEERKRAYERIESFGSPRGWESFPSVSPIRMRYDGISENVVRYIKQNVYDAIKKNIRRKNLPGVWEAFQKKKIREQMGRLYEIPESDILLEVLQRTQEEGRPKQGQVGFSSFSERTSERVLRYMRKYRTFASSPLGQKYKEQFTREFGDSMPELSHEIALATKKIIDECESTARWVRMNAVKALGNAWCVPVAYEIFRILDNYYNER